MTKRCHTSTRTSTTARRHLRYCHQQRTNRSYAKISTIIPLVIAFTAFLQPVAIVSSSSTTTPTSHNNRWGSSWRHSTTGTSETLLTDGSPNDDITATTTSSTNSANRHVKRRKNYYTTDDDDESLKKQKFTGLGREYDLFSRGGSETTTTARSSSSSSNNNYTPSTTTTKRRKPKPSSSSSSSSSRRSSPRQSSTSSNNPFSTIRSWLRENQSSLPRIQVRVEPNTTLKLRKRFRPLFKTEVTLGADFNTQLGVWQFKSSWEDKIIGGRLTLAGRELQLSKTWLLSVGAVEDLVTRLRLRAAIDLGTGKSYARLGFRTERLSPINVVEGFTLLRQLPLDGPEGHVKLEVKANFAFPEPEIEYSSSQRSIVGMGDVEVNIDELNLLLDY